MDFVWLWYRCLLCLILCFYCIIFYLYVCSICVGKKNDYYKVVIIVVFGFGGFYWVIVD